MGDETRSLKLEKRSCTKVKRSLLYSIPFEKYEETKNPM